MPHEFAEIAEHQGHCRHTVRNRCRSFYTTCLAALELPGRWRQMSIVSNTILIIFACGAGWSQPSEPRPQFEVASVKPAPPPEQRSGGRGAPRSTGGARTPDPSLFICDSCTLSELVLSAFCIQPYQLSAPSWMESERFTVNARVPVKTTVEQLRLMQQNLLAERFKLTYHHEEKEMPRWELVVAKGGPKVKASVGESTGTDGREPGATVTPDGRISAQYIDQSMTELAAILSKQVHMPVTDITGLTGKFDFTLTWAMDRGGPSPASDADSGPTIFNALQTQLGVKLEQKKGPVDRLVIDHAERVPTGN
jgi:uncharacterized protein (TIGR03435 family)